MSRAIVRLFCICFLSASLASCDTSRVYEDNHDLPKIGWAEDSILNFTFEIENAERPYNVLYNVRNTAEYGYYNLYIKYYLRDSADNLISSRLDEMYLMHPKTGQPFGDGLGDILDHQILVLPNFRFPKPGKYTLQTKQYMRADPLQEVLAFGVRVEEAEVE